MGVFLDYVGTGTVQAGGHYRLGLTTGKTIGLTANQAILCLRWTDSSHYFVLMGLSVYVNTSVLFGTAQLVDAALWVNRNWSTAPSGGTTILPLKPNENKMRDMGGASMGASLINTLQVATTAALTTGTRTQDTQAIGYAMFSGASTLGQSQSADLYPAALGNDHPLTLGVNEGIEVTVPTLQGATGQVVYYFNLRWAEVTQF